MQKIVQGVQRFQSEVFHDSRELFEHLADKQQAPQALFITCSDSRINPNLLTQTEPGDLFILRNAGNIIPPYSSAAGGEGATIEYAVAVLGIRNIILCGHSHCGAMRNLMRFDDRAELPAVAAWFSHAEATRRIIKEKYRHLPSDTLHLATIEENILVQIDNLRTHPSVAAGQASGQLKIHGWVYYLKTGDVHSYDHRLGRFVSFADQPPVPIPSPTRLSAANGAA